MAIEVGATTVICSRCGTAYGRRKGYFQVCYGSNYKGTGYLTICKECVNNLYEAYLSQCNDSKKALRQVCRKLDLYWSDKIYEAVEQKSVAKTAMTAYVARLSTIAYSGKSYDDTLKQEGRLWDFDRYDSGILPYMVPDTPPANSKSADKSADEPVPDIVIPDEVSAFWGPGYTPEMYNMLEQRRTFWMSRFPEGIELDIGTEALIRQICSLELDINRDRAAGRPVDKSVTALNTLLGSASLKPAQRKNEDIDTELSSVPLGVWLYRYENKRPLPEIDESLRDTNHLKKYIFTWMGHLCKMLGIKNGYTKMYEEEIERLRVAKPEYEDEDDETLLIDTFAGTENNGGDN